MQLQHINVDDIIYTFQFISISNYVEFYLHNL